MREVDDAFALNALKSKSTPIRDTRLTATVTNATVQRETSVLELQRHSSRENMLLGPLKYTTPSTRTPRRASSAMRHANHRSGPKPQSNKYRNIGTRIGVIDVRRELP